MEDYHIDFDTMTIANRISTIRNLFLDYVSNQKLNLEEPQRSGAIEELEWFIGNIQSCIDDIKDQNLT